MAKGDTNARQGRTVEEIEADLARTRVRMNTTLSALERKLTPSSLAGEAIKRVSSRSVRTIAVAAGGELVREATRTASRAVDSAKRAIAALPAAAEDGVRRVGRAAGASIARSKSAPSSKRRSNGANLAAGAVASVLADAAVKAVRAAITGTPVAPEVEAEPAASKPRKAAKSRRSKSAAKKPARKRPAR